MSFLFYLLPIEKKKEKKEHFNDREIHWHKVMSIVMSRKEILFFFIIEYQIIFSYSYR
jgi:hypothetical protein